VEVGHDGVAGDHGGVAEDQSGVAEDQSGAVEDHGGVAEDTVVQGGTVEVGDKADRGGQEGMADRGGQEAGEALLARRAG
jgi:hypothetical protein